MAQRDGLCRFSMMVLLPVVLVSTASGLVEEPAPIPAASVNGEVSWLYNPALLATEEEGIWSFHLARAGASVGNNSFSLDLYKEYNGTFLDEEDKDRILDGISGDQMKLALDVSAEVLSIRHGCIGFGSRSFASGNGGLDKEFADILLYGNELDRQYRFLNSGDGLAYSSVGLSYGRPAGTLADWDISMGASLRYVIGLGAARIVESSGETVTEIDGINGSVETVIRYSDGFGSGVAIDLGVWARKEPWEIQLSLNDLGPSISWDKGKEKSLYFEFEDWTFEQETEEDGHAYTYEDTTLELSSWSSPLPARMRMLAAYHFQWGQVHLLWRQVLRSGAGISTTPRVALGTEWNAMPWLKPRFEFEVGGPEGLSLAAGLGLHPGIFRMDVSVTTFRFPPMNSKGIGMSLGLGFGNG